MESANPRPSDSALPGPLAGLQAGVLGALAMLAWLGVSSAWQRRSFWTAANLMASYFYGEAALRPGFSRTTLSGIALYLLIYGTLGIAFGALVRGRVRGLRLLLSGLVFALAWYYVSFGFAWKKLAPLVALLHAERPTMAGHLLYGALLARGVRQPAPAEGESPAPPVPAD